MLDLIPGSPDEVLISAVQAADDEDDEGDFRDVDGDVCRAEDKVYPDDDEEEDPDNIFIPQSGNFPECEDGTNNDDAEDNNNVSNQKSSGMSLS